MFNKLKQLKDLRSQAKVMQNALAGEIITVEDQAKFPDHESLGKHLRDSIYKMPRPKEFVKKRDLEDLTE